MGFISLESSTLKLQLKENWTQRHEKNISTQQSEA
jgi:hypothetical protein